MERDTDIAPIRSQEDLLLINDYHERMVANFLLKVNPKLDVYHEPKEYSITEEEARRFNQKQLSTVPDFEVINPDTGRPLIIEVTTREKGKKGAQRRIMQLVNPTVPYVIFQAPDLYAISQAMGSSDTTVFESFITPSLEFVGKRIKPQPAGFSKPQKKIIY